MYAGQLLLSLDALVGQAPLEEAIKQWQTALVERALGTADATQAAAIDCSLQAQAAHRVDVDQAMMRLR